MIKQKVRERYIDKELFEKLLVELFGAGEFEIEVMTLKFDETSLQADDFD
jgi:hypothetical protein